jgi:hypothetical protein
MKEKTRVPDAVRHSQAMPLHRRHAAPQSRDRIRQRRFWRSRLCGA